jgi:hypothetical protein
MHNLRPLTAATWAIDSRMLTQQLQWGWRSFMQAGGMMVISVPGQRFPGSLLRHRTPRLFLVPLPQHE